MDVDSFATNTDDASTGGKRKRTLDGSSEVADLGGEPLSLTTLPEGSGQGRMGLMERRESGKSIRLNATAPSSIQIPLQHLHAPVQSSPLSSTADSPFGFFGPASGSASALASGQQSPWGFGGVPPQTPGLTERGSVEQLRDPHPLAAQPFSQTLPAPTASGGMIYGARQRPMGLMQPRQSEMDLRAAAAAAAGVDMSMSDDSQVETLRAEVERARNRHGPQCASIPRLQLSDYPDPATGKRTMYSVCDSCGSVEPVA